MPDPEKPSALKQLRFWIAVIPAAAGAAALAITRLGDPVLAVLGVVGVAFGVILFVAVWKATQVAQAGHGLFWDWLAKAMVVFVVVYVAVLAVAVAPPLIREMIRRLQGNGNSSTSPRQLDSTASATLEFGDALSALVLMITDELLASREDVIAMTAMRLKLDDKAVDGGRIEGSLTAERVYSRMETLDALGEYAALLNTHATTDQPDQIQAATTSFTASLRKVKAVSLDTSQLAALGSVAADLSGTTVEMMRTRAIRDVVPRAHPWIVALAGEIMKDFDPEGEHWSLAYDVEVEALRGAVVLARTATRPAAADPTLLAEADVMIAINSRRAALLRETVTKCMGELIVAQNNLCFAAQNPDVNLLDTESFVQSIQSLRRYTTILRSDAPML